MNIIFDLDGTLIDSRDRLYALFSDLVPESTLTFADYWAAKRAGVSNIELLTNNFKYTDGKLKSFHCKWMDQIESVHYLDFDTVHVGIEKMLESISDTANLFVCTARQNRDVAITQLNTLGLAKYFDMVLVTAQKVSKDQLITKYISSLSRSDWIIGDTAHDIKVGKLVGLNTCAVNNGFLSSDVLKRYAPSMVIESVASLAISKLNECFLQLHLSSS